MRAAIIREKSNNIYEVNTSRFEQAVLFNDTIDRTIDQPGSTANNLVVVQHYAEHVCALDGKRAEWDLQDPEAAVVRFNTDPPCRNTSNDEEFLE